MQRGTSVRYSEREIDFLRRLSDDLRAAIHASFAHGRPELAVALDTARDFIERVLAEPDPTTSRIAVARARAEISLEAWRSAIDLRH